MNEWGANFASDVDDDALFPVVEKVASSTAASIPSARSSHFHDNETRTRACERNDESSTTMMMRGREGDLSFLPRYAGSIAKHSESCSRSSGEVSSNS